MDAPRFPPVSGEALDGTPFVAPRDLDGACTVALVGFSVEHKAELESWVPFLDGLARAGRARAKLFIPLKVPKLLRGGIVKAMRAAVSEPELRASTVPLFVDVNALCDALGIAERAHLVVLLLAPGGTVAWRGGGPFSAEAGAALTGAIGG